MERALAVITLILMCHGFAGCSGDGSGSPSDVPDTTSSIPCEPECEDSDPCTIDACVDGFCLYTPSGNCMVLGCNSHQVTDPAIVSGELDPEGEAVKLAVTAGPGQLEECTGLDCEDDAPCCNSCNATLGLFVGDALLDLSLDPSWGCATDDCMNNAACSPLLAGVTYWVWGHAYPPTEDTTSPSLDVDGWCIQTTEEGLPGVYTGVLEPWQGTHQEVELTISWNEGWQIGLKAEAIEGESNDYAYYWLEALILDQQVSNITVGEADVSFDFTYCEIWEGQAGEPCAEDWQVRTVSARLTSRENRLEGDVSPFGGTGWSPPEDGPSREDPVPGAGAPEPMPPSPVEGALVVERVPPLEVVETQ